MCTDKDIRRRESSAFLCILTCFPFPDLPDKRAHTPIGRRGAVTDGRGILSHKLLYTVISLLSNYTLPAQHMRAYLCTNIISTSHFVTCYYHTRTTWIFYLDLEFTARTKRRKETKGLKKGLILTDDALYECLVDDEKGGNVACGRTNTLLRLQITRGKRISCTVHLTMAS